MKRLRQTLSRVLLAAALAALVCCRSENGEGNHLNAISNRATSGAKCVAWEQMLAALSSAQKKTLASDLCVYDGRNLIIAESVVADCELRSAMSEYFGRRLRLERDVAADEVLASTHSKEVVDALRVLWPRLESTDVLGGTDFVDFESEKYNLISDPSLQILDLSPLVEQLLKDGPLNVELSFLLFSRPIAQQNTGVVNELKRISGGADTRQKIYALALLERAGDSSALTKLKTVYAGLKDGDPRRKIVSGAIEKIRRGEQVVFSDLENLEYVNDH